MGSQKSILNSKADNDVITSPSATSINSSTSKQKTTKDPEAKASRQKQLIWLLICLSIFGLLIFFIINSCTPKYIYVKPYNVSINEQKTELKINNDYVVEFKDTNIVAYYYLPAPSGIEYLTQVNSNKGVIQFSITKRIDTEGHIYYYIGGITFSDDDNKELCSWLDRATNNSTLQPTSVDVGNIILQLLPTFILVLIIAWYFSKISKMSALTGKGEDSIFGIGKSSARIAKSLVKFSDVAGIEEEKNELIEIVDYLKNPEKYAAMGARTPRGVILYGPPGTGKTLLAKAVAGEASVPFFQASGSSFDDMLVGVGAKRVRDLFIRAKKTAPSIVFIDEIDSVAGKRGRNDIAGGSGGIADQTINQLLAEMDGFNTKTGVVVMAATNRLDSLDEAILRPGRFDRHIQVNLPDIKEREAILKIHARNKNLSPDVNLSDIARRTPGFSGAQLENILNEATLLAVRLNKISIGVSEIDEAIDRVIAGPAKHSRVITESEKKQIAYHEAGHALVGLHSKGGEVVEKITIIPRGAAAGYTLAVPKKQELAIQKKSDLLSIVRTTLGGRAAEEIIYGSEAISTGASNDLYKVTNIVKSMVTQLGMTKVGMTQFYPSEGTSPYFQKTFSEKTNQLIDNEIEQIIQSEYSNAKKIIIKNKKELELIVEALLILETIVKQQIDFIHKNLRLPNEALKKKKSFVNLNNKQKDNENVKNLGKIK